jgi:hypothetical protein
MEGIKKPNAKGPNAKESASKTYGQLGFIWSLGFGVWNFSRRAAAAQ